MTRRKPEIDGSRTQLRPARRLTQKELVNREPRCIYCEAKPNSLEHMPPIWLFEARQRPKGLEFATCKRCNNGTRGADLAVGFIARLRPFYGEAADPLFKEAAAQLATLERLVPGLRAEVFDTSPYEFGVMRREGQLHQMVRIDANGPILAGVLITFAAKLGMALYREHTGQALPLEGAVFVQPFLNGGISQEQADKLLEILPGTKTLQQGKREVSEQFAYAFNSDDRSIIMALASLHQNLHFMVLATSDPDHYAATVDPMFVARVSPGQLLEDRGVTSIDPRSRVTPSGFILPGLPRPVET